MLTELISKENNEVIFRIVIDAETFEKKMLALYKRETAGKDVGKDMAFMSTRAILQNYENLEKLSQQALNELLPQYYHNALKELDIQPFTMPQISVESAGLGIPCFVMVRILEEPSVENIRFEGLETEYTPIIATEEDVEKQINALMEKNGFTERNEEFVKSVGRHNTVEELVEDAKTSLEEMAASYTDDNKKRAVLDKLYEDNPVDLPAEVIDQQITMEIEQTQRQMGGEQQFEKYMEYRNMSMDDLRSQMRDHSKREVAKTLLLSKIADLLQLSVSDEEIDAELQKLPSSPNLGLPGLGPNMEEMRLQMQNTPGMKERFEQKIKIDKATDHVIKHGQYTTKEPVHILDEIPEYMK